MNTATRLSQIQTLTQQLKQARFRQIVVLQGDQTWRLAQLLELEPNSGLWVGDTPPHSRFQSVSVSSLPHRLGQEFDCAVFSAEQGIDADALGIVSGLIRAGGLLWILLADGEWQNPANQRFLSYPYQTHQAWSNFQQHLIDTLKHQAWWLTETEFSSTKLPVTTAQTWSALSHDQQQGLQSIEKVALGHRKRPLVIEADRGRGKTALLGLAAAQLIPQGKHLILCAARYAQCETAFVHAAQQLECEHQPGLVQTPQGSLKFHAPDDLVFNQPSCDLLMVDEAAHLPTPVLQQLVMHYPRVVFATTLHGYEGSGRGFSLRFKPFLQQHFPQYQSLQLQQPIRWNRGDPLEQTLNQLLFLDANLTDIESDTQINPSAIQIEHFAPQDISTTQLRDVFTLLIHAHYQTSPADLQHLMSAPDLTLYIAQLNSRLLGVMLVCDEGLLPTDLATNRRVKGHLAPQLLRQHSGETALLGLSSQRVLRLAVHPQARRQGIARRLIQYWQQVTPSLDFCSASFGVTHDLYHFWRQLGFQSMHLGAKRDKASGTHNILMVRSQHSALNKVKQHFKHQLPHSLMETLTDLPPGLVMELLAENATSTPSNTTLQAAQSYAKGERPYESVSQALWQLTIENPQRLQQCTETEQGVWLDKILKKLDWQTVAKRHRLAGRKEIEQLLKSLIT